MDSEKQLIIGYAGSLSSFDPIKDVNGKNWLKEIFWSYRVDNVDFNTRSGYYLFKGIQIGINKKLFHEEEIRLHLWGMIDEANQMQAEKMGLGKIVQIDGYLPKLKTQERVINCDLVFLPLECGKNGKPTLFVTGKVYEYLKLRKPVLCLTTGGDCAGILQSSGLGILLSPYDPVAIAEKLAELLRMKKENRFNFVADESFIAQFDFRELTAKLAEIFDKVLDNS